MKIFQLGLLCFMCFIKSYGQIITNSYGGIVVEIIKEKKQKKIYTKVEIKSAFPGGDSSWVQSLEQQLNQSIRAGKRFKKGIYTVSVVFILSKDGRLSDIRCEKDPGFGLCDRVVYEIKKSKKSQKWIPAVQRTNNIPD